MAVGCIISPALYDWGEIKRRSIHTTSYTGYAIDTTKPNETVTEEITYPAGASGSSMVGWVTGPSSIQILLPADETYGYAGFTVTLTVPSDADFNSHSKSYSRQVGVQVQYVTAARGDQSCTVLESYLSSLRSTSSERQITPVAVSSVRNLSNIR